MSGFRGGWPGLLLGLGLAVWSIGGQAGEDGEGFGALAEAFDAHERMRDPIGAGRDGDLEALGRWPEVGPVAVSGRLEVEREFRERLDQFDIDELDEKDRMSAKVMGFMLDSRLDLAEYGHQRMAFTSDAGFFSQPMQLAASTRPRNEAEARAWIHRLERLPAFFEGHRQWLALGAESGFVQPESITRSVIDQVRSIAEKPPEDSELLTPMDHLPGSMPDSLRKELKESALEAVRGQAIPAYRGLAAFLEEDYLAEPRSSLGASQIPGGRDYYRALVRAHTTLDLTPEEIHQTGLDEVQRIREEMDSVIEETGFEGAFEEFIEYLRTDPKFYAESAEELLMHAARIAKLADDAMPAYFRKLPRLSYGVRPVPDSMAPNYTTGRYWAGSLEAGEAGGYMVNTYALDQRPLYELPALTVHEAVPGHHHQIALAQELEGLPRFRQRAGITAFAEGWALYTEYLAEEMGIYRTPYEHFGRLTFEMWRACRLVVDTGIHWYGWDREEAEACLLENSALARHNVRTEVSRYISWPGQALAYKTGEILIRSLRQDAEQRLGDDFDLRAFHDHLLAEGVLPLSVAESRMKQWIEDQEAGN